MAACRRPELPRSREAGGRPQETSYRVAMTQETVGGSGANEVSGVLRQAAIAPVKHHDTIRD